MKIYQTQYTSYGLIYFEHYFKTEKLANNYIKKFHKDTNMRDWDIKEIDVLENLEVFKR